jgi:hypothetical protein
VIKAYQSSVEPAASCFSGLARQEPLLFPPSVLARIQAGNSAPIAQRDTAWRKGHRAKVILSSFLPINQNVARHTGQQVESPA